MAFKSFQDQHEYVQGKTGNDSADALSLFKSDINIAATNIRTRFSKYIFENEETITSVADQQEYELGPHIHRIVEARYVQSSIPYVLEEIASKQEWRRLNEHLTDSAGIPQFFYVDRNNIYLYPTPSNAGDSIKIIYDERVKPMTADDYDTGTVTVTNGDETVAGSGTTFTAAMVGRFLISDDGLPYRIASFTSATSLELEKKYAGTTASGATFRIGEQSLLDYDYLHIIPIFYALKSYYGDIKEDESNYRRYERLYTQAWEEAQRTYGRRVGSRLIRRGTTSGRDSNRSPFIELTSI